MAEQIRPLTLDAVRAAAREAAQQCIPLEQANDFERGSDLWREFTRAYEAAVELEGA